MNNIIEMKELIKKIKEADKAYFGDDKPIMADREYDDLVNRLKSLEESTGVVFAGSPTQNVSGAIKKRT